MTIPVHRAATATVIAGTIGILTAAGAAALPVGDLDAPIQRTGPPDPGEAVRAALELRSGSAIPDVPRSPIDGAPPFALDPDPDPGARLPAPAATDPIPDPVGTRHLGDRPAPRRQEATPSEPVRGHPVWSPATAGTVLAAVVLFHRLERDELLDNEIRARILDAVEEDPGGTATEYARTARVDRTTARYHLRMLERFDYVLSDRLRGRTRYFENHGRWDAFARRAIAHLRDRATRRLVAAVLEDPGCSCRELAEPAGLSESAVYRKVHRLDEIGLVEADGRPKRVRPPREARERIDRLVEVVDPA